MDIGSVDWGAVMEEAETEEEESQDRLAEFHRQFDGPPDSNTTAALAGDQGGSSSQKKPKLPADLMREVAGELRGSELGPFAQTSPYNWAMVHGDTTLAARANQAARQTQEMRKTFDEARAAGGLDPNNKEFSETIKKLTVDFPAVPPKIRGELIDKIVQMPDPVARSEAITTIAPFWADLNESAHQALFGAAKTLDSGGNDEALTSLGTNALQAMTGPEQRRWASDIANAKKSGRQNILRAVIRSHESSRGSDLRLDEHARTLLVSFVQAAMNDKQDLIRDLQAVPVK